jgi:hypothetical protein
LAASLHRNDLILARTGTHADLLQGKRLDVTVTQLITAAFMLARFRYPELRETWTSISARVGGLLPNSPLLSSIHRTGDLDMMLRAMEDDFSAPPEGGDEANRQADLLSDHYQLMLSELWVGAVYEIFRLLTDSERKLAPDSDAIMALAHDLRLLRIPLEKHEIAADRKLSEPLLMQRYPPNINETDSYHYSKSDARRAYNMPSGVSSRGSVRWYVIDVKSQKSYWLERRALSERIVALWGPVSPDGNLTPDELKP